MVVVSIGVQIKTKSLKREARLAAINYSLMCSIWDQEHTAAACKANDNSGYYSIYVESLTTYSAFVMMVTLLVFCYYWCSSSLDTLIDRSILDLLWSEGGRKLTPSPAKSDAHELGCNAFLFSAIWNPKRAAWLQSTMQWRPMKNTLAFYSTLWYDTTDQVFNLSLFKTSFFLSDIYKVFQNIILNVKLCM